MSNVTAIEGMFDSSRVFNQPLNNWNVSKVENMNGMFYKAKQFNQSLNNWNVSNVLIMRNMFFEATSFNQPLDNWNVNNLTDIENIFSGAISFNQPLDNWNVNIYKTGRSSKYISDISKNTNSDNSNKSTNTNNNSTSDNINSKNSYLNSNNSDNVNNLVNDVQNLVSQFDINMNITFQDLANPIKLNNIITRVQSRIIQDKTCDPNFNKIIKKKLDLILKKIRDVEKCCNKDELTKENLEIAKLKIKKAEEEKANRIAEELIREEYSNNSKKSKVIDTKQKKKKKKKKNINNKTKSNNMLLEITKSKYNSNQKTNKLDINKSLIKVKKTLQSLNLEEKLESIFLENEIYDNALQFLDIQDLVEIGVNNNDATRIIDEISKSKVSISEYQLDITVNNIENSNIKNPVIYNSVNDSSIKLSYKMNDLLTSLNVDKNIGHIFLKEEIDEESLSFLTISDLENIGISKNIAQKILNRFHSYEETKNEDFSQEKVIELSSYEKMKTEDTKRSKNIELSSYEEMKIEDIEKSKNTIKSTNNIGSIESIKSIPDEYICPITLDIMTDPVMALDGFTYERSEIEDWFRKGNNTSPKTNETLNCNMLIPNKNLKILIEEYKKNSC